MNRPFIISLNHGLNKHWSLVCLSVCLLIRAGFIRTFKTLTWIKSNTTQPQQGSFLYARHLTWQCEIKNNLSICVNIFFWSYVSPKANVRPILVINRFKWIILSDQAKNILGFDCTSLRNTSLSPTYFSHILSEINITVRRINTKNYDHRNPDEYYLITLYFIYTLNYPQYIRKGFINILVLNL